MIVLKRYRIQAARIQNHVSKSYALDFLHSPLSYMLVYIYFLSLGSWPRPETRKSWWCSSGNPIHMSTCSRSNLSISRSDREFETRLTHTVTGWRSFDPQTALFWKPHFPLCPCSRRTISMISFAAQSRAVLCVVAPHVTKYYANPPGETARSQERPQEREALGSSTEHIPGQWALLLLVSTTLKCMEPKHADLADGPVSELWRNRLETGT